MDILFVARTILVTTPQRWTSLSQTVPVDLLIRRPLPEEWSAVECLQHVIEVEWSYQARLEAFLSGQNFPVINPDDTVSRADDQLSPDDMADWFASLRAKSLDQIDRLAESDLARRAIHPQLGPVTLGEMVHTWAAHDLNHLMQAEKAILQPFLQGVGPWIKFLGHHVMKSE